MLGQGLDERTETIYIESFDFLDPSIGSAFGIIDRFRQPVCGQLPR